MKASLKFREEQKPLFRAKVPLNILGLPFQSGIVGGDPKELSINLSTFFDSGPSIKLSYRPNDSWNPFSFVVKTGIGPYGSPNSSSMLMSAEFKLVDRGNLNPSPIFVLHFKPRFGDFSFKKSQSSIFSKKTLGALSDVVSDDDPLMEVVDHPGIASGFSSSSGKKVSVFAADSSPANAIAGVLSGTEVAARTTLPIAGRAFVNCRWGFRVPAELNNSENATAAGISFQKLPFLVMNKIGIEHVDSRDSKGKAKMGNGLEATKISDLGEACFIMKRQLEVLRAENGLLRNAVEGLRKDLTGIRVESSVGDSDGIKYREIERSGMHFSSGRIDRRSNEKKPSEYGFPGKLTEFNGNEELKKTSTEATPV